VRPAPALPVESRWHLLCSVDGGRVVRAVCSSHSRESSFFDLFAAYNEALWPGAAGLWIASAVRAWKLFARR
jgi:hypothetical protein